MAHWARVCTGEACLSGICWPPVEVHRGRPKVSPAESSETVAARDRRRGQREVEGGRTRRQGQCCLDEGPEPPGSGRQGFRWPLAAHWEASFGGPRGAQIPSAEGDLWQP